MKAKKTGWAAIESRKEGRVVKEPKHKDAKAKPAKKREQKPPFGVLVGRRMDSGEYALARESFTSAAELLSFVSNVIKKETHADGLREVMVHLRPVAEVK